MNEIYFDNNATTKIDDRVLEFMMPYLTYKYGNSSCTHKLGLSSKVAMNLSRHKIATFLNCMPENIIFTSGATESNNTAIIGAIYKAKQNGIETPHIISTVIEHPCVLKTLEFAKEFLNCEVTLLDVSEYGQIIPLDMLAAMKHNTILISIMVANNEIGTVQKIPTIVELCKKKNPNVLFHTDATQAIGKKKIDLSFTEGIDMLSLSSHKIFGPKGVGALFLRNKDFIVPFMNGGNQEFGLRSGTENIPAIVGFGEACFILKQEPNIINNEYVDILIDGIDSICDKHNISYIRNSPNREVDCINNTINYSLDVDTNELRQNLNNKGIYISAGSACSSNKPYPSYVVKACRRSDKVALKTIRISLSKFNTLDQIKTFLEALDSSIKYI